MHKISDVIKAVTDVSFGFCPFSAVSDRLLECRAKNRLPKNAKTIIMFAFPYKVLEEKPKNISRYAAVPDYHRICGNMLLKISEELKKAYKDFCFEPFIDNSPIPEVFAAVLSGLGVRGKNGLLITERYGSWVFLGEIVTDMNIKTERNGNKVCISCGLCEKACPVAFDKVWCISAVSQQKKPLTAEQAALLTENGSVWGCDICQNVCPLNKNAEKTEIEEFKKGYRNGYVKGESIEERAYAWRGEAVIKRNSELFD